MLFKRIALATVKIFLLLIVLAMVRFQLPELHYDMGSEKPVEINSLEQLDGTAYRESTFAVVHGTPDFDRAATFAKHGVVFTYFLLNEYGTNLIVRTAEPFTEEWETVTKHVGRLKAYSRMPFRRSIAAGFKANFDVTIPGDAYFLGRDDVPRVSGWSIGALVFPGILWCILFYFFFIHGHIQSRVKKSRA